jgi:hypothetical protein
MADNCAPVTPVERDELTTLLSAARHATERTTKLKVSEPELNLPLPSGR